jgi:hypothetical protein
MEQEVALGFHTTGRRDVRRWIQGSAISGQGVRGNGLSRIESRSPEAEARRTAADVLGRAAAPVAYTEIRPWQAQQETQWRGMRLPITPMFDSSPRRVSVLARLASRSREQLIGRKPVSPSAFHLPFLLFGFDGRLVCRKVSWMPQRRQIQDYAMRRVCVSMGSRVCVVVAVRAVALGGW